VVCDEVLGARNETEAMECNKTWKTITPYKNSSQPRVLKMEANRWLKHGCGAISNGSKWKCRKYK